MMRVAALALLLLGCNSTPEPALGVVMVRSGVWEGEDIVEYHVRTVYSQCVMDELSRFSDEEIEAWRDAFCNQEAHPGLVNCSSVEIESDEAAHVFVFHNPIERSEESYYVIGPIPMPEGVPCDPYVDLYGPYWVTPTHQTGIFGPPSKAWADGEFYQ